jgi:hypothetical protein
MVVDLDEPDGLGRTVRRLYALFPDKFIGIEPPVASLEASSSTWGLDEQQRFFNVMRTILNEQIDQVMPGDSVEKATLKQQINALTITDPKTAKGVLGAFRQGQASRLGDLDKMLLELPKQLYGPPQQPTPPTPPAPTAPQGRKPPSRKPTAAPPSPTPPSPTPTPSLLPPSPTPPSPTPPPPTPTPGPAPKPTPPTPSGGDNFRKFLHGIFGAPPSGTPTSPPGPALTPPTLQPPKPRTQAPSPFPFAPTTAQAAPITAPPQPPQPPLTLAAPAPVGLNQPSRDEIRQMLEQLRNGMRR